MIIIDTSLLIWNNTENQNNYEVLEFFIGICYLFEMIIKMFAYGLILNDDSYLRNKWNILDFSIAISIILYRFFLLYAAIDLGILRNFVILRLLRIKSFDVILERLYYVTKDLLKIYFFVFFILLTLAILTLHFWSGILKYRCLNTVTGIIDNSGACGNSICGFQEICIKSLNNFDNGITNFDNIFSAFLQNLKIITLNNWTISLFLVHKAFISFAIVIFIFLIVVGNFIILNLILAVLKVKYSEVSKNDYSKKKKKFLTLRKSENFC